jgi:hypothetical protein
LWPNKTVFISTADLPNYSVWREYYIFGYPRSSPSSVLITVYFLAHNLVLERMDCNGEHRYAFFSCIMQRDSAEHASKSSTIVLAKLIYLFAMHQLVVLFAK